MGHELYIFQHIISCNPDKNEWILDLGQYNNVHGFICQALQPQ